MSPYYSPVLFRINFAIEYPKNNSKNVANAQGPYTKAQQVLIKTVTTIAILKLFKTTPMVKPTMKNIIKEKSNLLFPLVLLLFETHLIYTIRVLKTTFMELPYCICHLRPCPI